jgi:hypothetical protein
MSDHRRLYRGDTVSLNGSQGTVLRVARDESWADVGWWLADGSYGWTERQPKPELLVLLWSAPRG